MDNEELEKRLNWYEKKYGPYIEKRGLHNWKNLFRKPNMYDWTILIMLLMALFIAFAYNHDIAQCRYTIENFDELCFSYKQELIGRYASEQNIIANYSFNISEFEDLMFKEANSSLNKTSGED